MRIIFIGAILLLLALASFSAEAKCRISGCSGEICEKDNESPAIGICIWAEHFACYKSASCEEQQDGKCGWTMSQELKQCITDKQKTGASPKPMEAK